MNDTSSGWPRLPDTLPQIERLAREIRFKQLGFLLLYRLADCTAGIQETSRIRRAQGKFLDSLTVEETAILCCLVEVMGQGFLNITMSPQYFDIIKTVGGSMSLAVPLGTDPSTENWLRECMCVFEDRLQRYGSFSFASSSLSATFANCGQDHTLHMFASVALLIKRAALIFGRSRSWKED
jgi:hypothetical protein